MYIYIYIYIQCAARITRHRAASLFPGSLFSRIFLILGYQILMILSDFGGPRVHFLRMFDPGQSSTGPGQSSKGFCDFQDASAAKT